MRGRGSESPPKASPRDGTKRAEWPGTTIIKASRLTGGRGKTDAVILFGITQTLRTSRSSLLIRSSSEL